MRLILKATTLFATVAVAALALAGCSSATASHKNGGKIAIVASTNVWGDVAKQIGGDAVTITSVISDPAQDPHSYEANAQVQLALSKADVVIENGGGYDDFVDTLLKGAGNDSAKILNAVDISGFDQGPGLNEHVWYDFPTVKKVAAKIAGALSALDASRASVFEANLKTFDSAMTGLEGEEAAIKASSAHGSGVAITEPVPLYLLAASGLVDKTPEAFSEAVEEGTDVPPAALKKALALFSEHKVVLLAYNEQTSGPETDQVIAAAKAAGISTVAMRETLPEGKDYLSWMTDNLDSVKAALLL
jgi:zinc/manganese transport system substrate-binding protein